MSNQIQTQKTVTRTVRIGRIVESRLQEIAAREEVTANFLVNQTLRRFVEWEYYTEKFGFSALPTLLLQRMLDFATDQEAARLGRWAGSNLMRELTIFRFREFSVETALRALELTSLYGRRFEYVHDTQAADHYIVLNHRMGLKWSMFYSALLKTTFGELLKRRIEIDLMRNQVAARIGG